MPHRDNGNGKYVCYVCMHLLYNSVVVVADACCIVLSVLNVNSFIDYEYIKLRYLLTGITHAY